MHINQSWAVENAAVVLRPKPSEFPFHSICAANAAITFLSVISWVTAASRDRRDVDGVGHGAVDRRSENCFAAQL